jgi:hypothetical protein
MKSKGDLSKHTIRKPSKPFIAKMKPVLNTPEYTIIFEPENGTVEYIIVEVKLPLIVRIFVIDFRKVQKMRF